MTVFELFLKSTVRGLLSIALISCGGGGSSSSSTSTGTVSGTAATGAPITNAAVTVFDAKGNVVCTTTTDSNGLYSCAGINSTSNPAPYIVKVVGGVGDSVDTLYAVAPSAGTANVSHISNAIAAAVAKGDPSGLEAGTTASAADVNNADSAHQAALTNLYATFSYSGSVVTGAFNSTLDGLLDNTHARVLGDGSVELGSSQGFVEDGLMGDSGVVTGSSAKIAIIASGSAPSSSNAASIPALTSKVTAASLETLRAKLQACFSHPAAQRATLTSGTNGTPVWSNIHADCQGIDDGNFKHESFYWIDGSSSNSTASPSNCTTAGSAYCLGEFGAMLTNTTYDNLQFLKPRNMRPVGAAGSNLWHVQFPVMYCDDASQAGVTCGSNGTRGQFGDVIGSYSFAVVKYDSASGNYLMHGDQRNIQSYILPTAQLVQKGTSNTYRVETNLNIYIRPYSIRSLKPNNNNYNQNAVWPVYATVTPLTTSGMLPAGGVTLANKINIATLNSGTTLGANSNISSLPSSGTSGNSLFFNVCDGYMNFENKAIAPSSGHLFNYTAAISNVASCSGLLRMAYGEYARDANGILQPAAAGSYPPAAYPSGMINPSQITNYNADGTLTSTPSAWPTNMTAKKGEPYLFTIYLSAPVTINGVSTSTLSYVNRLPSSLLTVTQAARVTYPLLDSTTGNTFASFMGSSNSLAVAWSKPGKGYVFQSALMWDRAEGSTNNGVKVGATSNTISCSMFDSSIRVPSFTPGATVTQTDPLNCKDTGNWVSGAAGANVVDSGILQLKARTPDSLFISTQMRQY
jgi:hypothetical protein